ncbi:MAG TPA: nucleoside deaminase [Alphaproteobacteria bacterium]
MTAEIIFMQAALEQAKCAVQADEVPIGAVLVDIASGEIAARAFNRTVTLSDPTAHAEILAIREVCQRVGAQRIPEYDLYVTLEPCPMCAAAISFARIRRVIYGADDPKSGGLSAGPCLYNHAQLHHKPEVVSGVLAAESAMLLQDFFKTKRHKNNG